MHDLSSYMGRIVYVDVPRRPVYRGNDSKDLREAKVMNKVYAPPFEMPFVVSRLIRRF